MGRPPNREAPIPFCLNVVLIGAVQNGRCIYPNNREKSMSKKRDRAYYEARLKRDFPRIFAELRAGKFKSVRQAAAEAGLIHLPTRFDALKREWKRGTYPDRTKFINWLKATRYGLPPLKSRAPTPAIADSAGILLIPVVAFLKNWIDCYNTTAGRIMQVMGFRNFDTRLSQSLGRRVGLPADILSALAVWLKAQGYTGK